MIRDAAKMKVRLSRYISFQPPTCTQTCRNKRTSQAQCKDLSTGRKAGNRQQGARASYRVRLVFRMSFQIFLHGKILGTEEFLRSAANDIEGRAQWASLLSEVTPRALLAELGLSAMLLGASGGGQFLLVIPVEARTPAEEFLSRVAADAAQRSSGAVRLV